jgi:o-succinylbenzoate synthase
MKGRIIPYLLTFKQAAGTSRGSLTEKRTYFIHVQDEQGNEGLGECGVFPGLSAEYGPEYEKVLARSLEDWKRGTLNLQDLRAYPSILMGWETALKNLSFSVTGKVFDCDFLNGKAIKINGLVWMGTQKFMAEQIAEKIDQGFDCIKMKIGAIDWETEHTLLKGIRDRFSADQIEVRVDANGAFKAEEAMKKLEMLAALKVHSIEQPIKQGQYKAMAELCKNSPIPIALDEELIGIHALEKKMEMLDEIAPAFIILKPSLVGAFSGCDEWISLAEERNIDWWATSALESNIGLNAIAQWTSTKNPSLPQGLGTGSLFLNNIASPLEVEKGFLRYRTDGTWNLDAIA